MAGGISRMAKQELLATIRDRYRESSKKDKGRILDEFIAVTGHHRKHGTRLLGQSGDAGEKLSMIKGRRIYDEAVREAVILAWEATDRICGKRLKAALPHLVESMERHGHLDLNLEVRERLLAASAATLDRLLKPVRSTVSGRRRRRRNLSPGRNIPVRAFADWNRPPPGFLEIDLVAHCGDNMGGSFVYSLVATDVCTGWTEAVPLLVREQSLVVTGLEAIGRQLPFPIRGIDSDNDSVFINATLSQYCGERGIEFTRSRPYRKNDQAWIEQKNGAVIRRFVGHDRYSGPVAGQTMAHLYRSTTSTPCLCSNSSPFPSWKFSDSPTITLVMPNCTIAPAHMLHGIRVEYTVIPRKSETVLPALNRQLISACMTTALSWTRRFRPVATSLPCPSTRAAPMGMPPSAAPVRASPSAASMNWSTVILSSPGDI